METLFFTLEPIGERLDKAVLAHLPQFSREGVQRLIKEGLVTCNGLALSTPSLKLKTLLDVQVILPEPEQAEPMPENIPLDILYEDDDLIVVNKPINMVVHPASGNWSGTLVNALLFHCGSSLSGIGGVARPGLVHRLDKDTSGVMVVAKNDVAHRHLSAQFQDHGRTGVLERAYQALVWGDMPPTKTISLALARDPRNREKIAVAKKGKEAITHVKRIHNYEHVSHIECRLETGRTHQIRVHLAQTGHPLLGDLSYGLSHKTKISKLSLEAQEALIALNRQALHAYKLTFAHPRDERVMRFETPLPADFTRLLSLL